MKACRASDDEQAKTVHAEMKKLRQAAVQIRGGAKMPAAQGVLIATAAAFGAMRSDPPDWDAVDRHMTQAREHAKAAELPL